MTGLCVRACATAQTHLSVKRRRGLPTAMQVGMEGVGFTGYDAALLGLVVVTVAVASCGVAFTQKETSDDYSTLRAWKRVMGLIIPQAPQFVLALTAAIFESICLTLQPLYMGTVIDKVTAISLKGGQDVNEGVESMAYTCAIIVCLDAIKCIAVYARECLNNSLGDFARQKAQVLCESGASNLFIHP